MFVCHLCNKQFASNQSLQRHSNKKVSCQISTNQCKYCEKILHKSYNRKRHETQCGEKQSEQNYKLLKDKVHDLELIIKNNHNGITTNNNTTNTNTNTNSNNNITNNITNNIVINKYGNEDISHITSAQITGIIKKCYRSVPEFIKLKHFDQQNPQNNNVYIADIKSRHAFIYDGTKWMITDKNELLDDLYLENCDFLECKFIEKMDELDHHTVSRFQSFIDKKEEDETSNKIKQEIRVLLYNERQPQPTQPL